MIKRVALLLWALLLMPAAASAADPADLFGAREGVADIALSPDGTKVAYIAPGRGQGNALYTVDLASGTPKLATAADGKPLRLNDCNWVSNDRLVCTIFAVQKSGATEVVAASRLVAVNSDGSGIKLLSQLPGMDAHWTTYFGGAVLDWLPDEEGAVLMGRSFVPEGRIGTLVEKRDQGFGVERIDTRTLKKSQVEAAKANAMRYISDGRGTIRIMGMQPPVGDGYAGRQINYFYRQKGSREWLPLGTYDIIADEGFNPLAVDPEKDVVYGLKKKDGRAALYSVALNPAFQTQLVYAHPEVDVDGLIRVGRHRRVVGVTFATDKRQAVYFDQDVQGMVASLGKALPQLQTYVVDSSRDGTKMLVWSGSDVDPGNYYVFDRSAKRLNKILLARQELAGTKLASVKPVRVRGGDGTMIPGYLTLPPGSSGKNLTAIVLPHGGPEARDEWGFDWLAQYFANRGYAVLQPNFRGSTGYGDAWFQNNGFRSWRTAVGDVVDAGKWLVSEGIADPSKLAIVGWSYGGYAALQSNVLDPDLYKAVVAIAPVTDFKTTVEESRGWANFRLEQERVGGGSHTREGSPAQNASRFKAPVLLFHGDHDRNVGLRQSQMMADRLRDAGKRQELIVYPGLDHQLDDSQARADMLRRADQFLRSTMGL